jgi:hypothetical protein
MNVTIYDSIKKDIDMGIGKKTTYSSSTSDTRPHRTTIAFYLTLDGNLQKGQTKRQMTADFANIIRHMGFYIQSSALVNG